MHMHPLTYAHTTVALASLLTRLLPQLDGDIIHVLIQDRVNAIESGPTTKSATIQGNVNVDPVSCISYLVFHLFSSLQELEVLNAIIACPDSGGSI